MDPLTVGILVISDTAYTDPGTDAATKILSDVFTSPSTSNVEWKIKETKIVPDRIDKIQETIRRWTEDDGLNLLVTTGGTGFAVKDVTPEVFGLTLKIEESLGNCD